MAGGSEVEAGFGVVAGISDSRFETASCVRVVGSTDCWVAAGVVGVGIDAGLNLMADLRLEGGLVVG